ncbi:MAG: flagellar hook-associated protein FlgK [Hyphomicrobiales bacterium]|nr:flagellar hook-associated protein FlgK [Hyphomicrobiales bacterium]MBV9426495.1 flagellar hook-associated protein FlgK [Bradyrhizobiaceae bacterium]
MSLIQALTTAMSGLNAAQTGLTITAGNVANASTPGYVVQTPDLVETSAGNVGTVVDVAGVNRTLDHLVQNQLWTETSGGSYADAAAQLYGQLQQIYGAPGAANAFDKVFNNFTAAMQALATSPASAAAQSGAASAAQQLAQNLNGMSSSIQGLRTQAEQGIAADVQQANAAMQQIARINQQLSANTAADSTTATLEDQRDQAITQLAQLMNIKVVQGGNNQVAVFTGSGTQLVGAQASTLSFNAVGALSPNLSWSADPTKDGAGTITLTSPAGDTTDLIANKAIQSGQVAAYLQMRDQILPQAQGQLDTMASQMAQALSNQTTAGAPVTVGAQSGFTVDIGNLLPGNSAQITYTDAANIQHSVTVVRVDDPAALPLPSSSDPNQQVIGVNFTGGMGSVVSQLNAALGTQLQFSNPSGTTLQVLNATPSVTAGSMSATATMTSLTSGSPQLPLFLDGTTPITSAITSAGSQDTGLAARIAVNPAVVANPSSLIVYQSSPITPAGDPTRPNFIVNQLNNAQLTFAPPGVSNGQAPPFTGTLANYLSQVVSQQAQAATAATNLQEGQDVVVNALQQRLSSTSGVNIDQEMSNLITLQNTYGANARVMTTIQQMMATLLQVIP